MTVVFDLRSGVSGDMLLSSLLDLYSRENSTEDIVGSIADAASIMSPTEIEVKRMERFGNKGILTDVSWEPLESGTIGAIDMISFMDRALERISANDRIWEMAKTILRNILDAEMTAHRCSTVEEVHLHEAGTPDTIVDAIGISLLFDRLEMDGEWVWATPISLGGGKVDTQHGKLEVPVPAVRAMIRNTPVRKGPVQGELATPTGVAAVNAFVDIWMEHERLGDTGSVEGTLMGAGFGSREYPSFSNMLTIWEVEE